MKALFVAILLISNIGCSSMQRYMHQDGLTNEERRANVAQEEEAEEARWAALTPTERYQEEMLELQRRQTRAQEAATSSQNGWALFNSVMQIRQQSIQNNQRPFQPLKMGSGIHSY